MLHIFTFQFNDFSTILEFYYLSSMKEFYKNLPPAGKLVLRLVLYAAIYVLIRTYFL